MKTGYIDVKVDYVTLWDFKSNGLVVYSRIQFNILINPYISYMFHA